MKKICVVTATRAEYGLLRNVIRRIDRDAQLELCLLVTGMHLDGKYGSTVQEIEEDGFPIAGKIEILSADNGEAGAVKTMANALLRFGETFGELKPDMLVVLGDRYEILPICEAAMVYKIPICHISGGELTEGAMDDCVRHCITKLSQLHFPGCEDYRRRIIQMGEQPDCVFNYGDVGVENIMKMDYMELGELEQSIGFLLDRPYACVTFHPETLNTSSPEKQVEELLAAIEEFTDMKFVFTGANADVGGEIINQMVKSFADTHENCIWYASLGIRRYLSLLKRSVMIIGNSSSGIVEAPCFGIPTVNIGGRQRGRLAADSVIHCEAKKNAIIEAMKKGRSAQFCKIAANVVNPYGSGETSKGIVKEIKNYLNGDKKISKKFYDLHMSQIHIS